MSARTRVQPQLTRFNPVSTEAFTYNGQSYVALRFAEDKGPTLPQAIDAYDGKNGKAMLTDDESHEIVQRHNRGESFPGLKPGEWTYVRNPEVESRYRAAFLAHNRGSGRLVVDSYCRPAGISPVVILRETGRELAAQVRETLPPIIAALEPSANQKILQTLRRLHRLASE